MTAKNMYTTLKFFKGNTQIGLTEVYRFGDFIGLLIDKCLLRGEKINGKCVDIYKTQNCCVMGIHDLSQTTQRNSSEKIRTEYTDYGSYNDLINESNPIPRPIKQRKIASSKKATPKPRIEKTR